jgi:hypothetical protein
LIEEVNSVSNNEKDFPENEGINNANFIQNYKKTSATNLSSWFANIGKPLKFQKLNKNGNIFTETHVQEISNSYVMTSDGSVRTSNGTYRFTSFHRTKPHQ